MASPKVFQQRLIRIGNDVPVLSNVGVINLSAELLRRVAEATPVDSGEARSNWIVSLSTPSFNRIPPYSPGVMLGRSERGNLSATVNIGRRKLALRRSGETVYIQNNTRYIERINVSSRQSPPNFFQRAVVGIRPFIKTIKVLR